MKKITLTAAAMLAGTIATPALAQDTTPEFFNGLYVGGTLSSDSQTNDRGDTLVFDTNRDGAYDNTVRTVAGADAFSPGFCAGSANSNVAAAGCSSDQSDFGYSARIGADNRIAKDIVVGFLVEGAMSESKDFTSGFSTTPASYTTSRSLDYSVSARGRLGFSPGDGRGLFYVTGGASYANIDHEFSTTNGANSFDVINGNDMVWGYQAGAGAELMVTNNIGFGVEYLYSNYNDDEAFVAVGPGTAGATNPFLLTSGGTNLRPSDTDFELQSLRATLSFHF